MKVPVNLLIDDKLLKRVEEYRHENRLKSRLDALRLLIEKGLEVVEGKPGKKGK